MNKNFYLIFLWSGRCSYCNLNWNKPPVWTLYPQNLNYRKQNKSLHRNNREIFGAVFSPYVSNTRFLKYKGNTEMMLSIVKWHHERHQQLMLTTFWCLLFLWCWLGGDTVRKEKPLISTTSNSRWLNIRCVRPSLSKLARGDSPVVLQKTYVHSKSLCSGTLITSNVLL